MKVKFLLLAIVFSSLSAHSAWCPVDFSMPQTTQPDWDRLQQSNEQSFTSLKQAMTRSIEKATGDITNGTAVAVSQESASSGDIAVGIANNAKSQLAIENSLRKVKEFKKTQEEFGSLSVGYNNCKAVEIARKINLKGNQVRASASEGTNFVTARAGHYANRDKAMATRLALHDIKYCTSSQVESGLCPAVGSREGRSLMASTLFVPAIAGDDNDMDKDALINNMAGLPDNSVPSGLSNSSLGISYQDNKRQKDSLKSIAIYALKYIQAQTTNVSPNSTAGHHTDTNIGVQKSEIQAGESAKDAKKATDNEISGEEDNSYIGQMQRDVLRHFGGTEEYIARKKYLASATEKGVLVEMNKTLGLMKRQVADLIEKEQIKLALVSGETAGIMRYIGMDSKIEDMRQQATNSRLSATTQ